MEEIFTSYPDHCTSGQSAHTAFEILHDGASKEAFECDLTRMLEQQLVQPRQESIDRILSFSKSL